MTTAKTIAIVAGSYHRAKVEEMLDAARQAASEHNITISDVIWVHGSLEKPLAVKKLLKRDSIDGVVTLGIIERGETKHGLVMGQASITALIDLQLQYEKPVGVGILGPEILPSQIPSRLRPYAREAVIAIAGMFTCGVLD